MAIYLYSGTPGSGKSLHSAKDIISWFRKGLPVITNFDVDLSPYPKAKHTCVDDDDLTPDYLAEFSRNFFGDRKVTKKDEDSILLVIDECQLLFNAREWQQSGRAQWLSFFTQHRKLGYDIILIAQFDRMVDRQIRSLIEHEYIHRKMSNFGWQGKILSLIFGGKTFIAVKMWYPLHERLGSEIFHARKWMYSVYDTYAAFSAEAESKPAGVDLPATAPDPEPAKFIQCDHGFRILQIDGLLNKERTMAKIPVSQFFRKKQTKPKKHRKPRSLSGRYERPWMKPSKGNNGGKFLRPGGRDESGWTSRQRKLI